MSVSEIDNNCEPEYGNVLDFLSGKMRGTPSVPDEYQRDALNQVSSKIAEIYENKGNSSFNKKGFEDLVMTIWPNMESTRGGMFRRNQQLVSTTGALVPRTPQANRRLVRGDFVALLMFLGAIFLAYLAYTEFCQLLQTVTGDTDLTSFTDTFRNSLTEAIEQSGSFTGYASLSFFHFIVEVFTLTAGGLTADILRRHQNTITSILSRGLRNIGSNALATCMPTPDDTSWFSQASTALTRMLASTATSNCIIQAGESSTRAALNEIQSQTERFGIRIQASINTIHSLINYACLLGYPSASWLIFRITTGFNNNRLQEILGPSAVPETAGPPERDPSQRTLTEMWNPERRGGKKSKKYKRKTRRTRRHKKYTKKRKTHMRR
jgi:hypothetical protein